MTEADRQKGYSFLGETIKANAASAVEQYLARIDALAEQYRWTEEECAEIFALVVDAANRSVEDLVEVVTDGAKRGIIL